MGVPVDTASGPTIPLDNSSPWDRWRRTGCCQPPLENRTSMRWGALIPPGTNTPRCTARLALSSQSRRSTGRSCTVYTVKHHLHTYKPSVSRHSSHVVHQQHVICSTSSELTEPRAIRVCASWTPAAHEDVTQIPSLCVTHAYQTSAGTLVLLCKVLCIHVQSSASYAAVHGKA